MARHQSAAARGGVLALRRQPRPAVTGGYRYRGGQVRDAAEQQREEFSRLLAEARVALLFRSSRIRDLSASLNLLLAQALCDGAPVSDLSRLTHLSASSVRRTGLAFDDLFPSGLPVGEHLKVIARLLRELTALERSKAEAEEERLNLLGKASKQQILDDFELASLTGLRPEHIRKMTRGSVSPRQRMLTARKYTG